MNKTVAPARRALPLAALAAALVLGGCSALSDLGKGLALDRRSLPLEAAAGAARGKELASRLAALAKAAGELGWPSPSVPARMLEGSGQGLGYAVAFGKDGAEAGRATAWSKAELDSLVKGYERKGLRSSAVSLLHLRPRLDKASPLPLAALEWNDAQLGDWLAWEWAAEAIGAKGGGGASAISFAAWKLNEAVITRTQGPGSIQLARWRESLRDRRTFQSLARDLQEQVRGIVAAHADPADREATLRRIERNWFSVYRQQYPNRFVTNEYKDFGKAGWADPLEIASIELDTSEWASLESRFPGQVEDGSALLKALR